MPNPVADITTIKNLVWDTLNLARATYGVFDDNSVGNPQFQVDATLNSIINSDLQVANAIAETLGHPQRGYFINPTPATIANQGSLPATRVGPIDSILIVYADETTRLGTPVATDWLSFFINDSLNTFGGTAFTDGYYAQIGDKLYFKGDHALVSYAEVTRGTTSALVSPPNYTDTITKLAISFEAIKQGNYPQVSAFYGQLAGMDLQMIRSRETVVPQFQLFQMAA